MEDFNPLQIRTLKRIVGDYNKNGCSFGAGSGPSAWGSISGNIGDQTDLSTALDAKIPLTGTSAMSGSFLPATTNVSDFGDNTFRFRGGYFQNVYASGKMFVGALTSSAYTGLTVDVGLTSFLGGTTTVNGAILPNVGSLNIGGTSSGQHWGNVYTNNVVANSATLTLAGGNSKIILEHTAGLNVPKVQIGYNNTSTVTNLAKVGYATLNSPNTNQYGWDVAPNINQTGTASYTVSRISPRIIASVGTTNKLFSVGTNDSDYGTGTHSEVFGVDASGNTYTAGNALFGTNINAGFRVDINGTVRATQYNIGAISTNYIAGGGSGEININNAGMDLRVGGSPAIWTFVDNSKDIGTSDKRWRNGYFGTGITVGGTSAPTHAITLPASSTGIAIHNQSDQVTNFEVGRLYWNSNTFTLSTERAGTGSFRAMAINAGTGITFNIGGVARMSIGSSSATGIVNFPAGSSVAGASAVGLNPTMSSSSGLQWVFSNLATINQTGTAGYIANYTSIYEQAVASGPKLLADWGVNSAANGAGTHTSRARIDNTGKTTIADDFVNETVGKGWVTRSPDGTYYRVTVNNGGTTLIITAI